MTTDMTLYAADQQQRLEEQIGEPLVTSLAGLSGSGATGAAAASLVSGGFGWLKNKRANEDAGGAAAITFTKNRYAAVALTQGGDVVVYRGKISRRGYEVEETIGSWPRDEVELAIRRGRVNFGLEIEVPAEDRRFSLELTRYKMEEVVEAFAAGLGVPVSS